MDRLIAPNSVDAAHADTAPVTGTPAYATDGNPATNVPATLWPSYQYNAIQEELIAILAAARITADRTTKAQIAAAVCDYLYTLRSVIDGAASRLLSYRPLLEKGQESRCVRLQPFDSRVRV